MSEEIIWGLSGMIFLILLIAVLFIPLSKIAQTKLQSDKEKIYQKLASDAVETQKETAQLNKKLAKEMEEVKKRLTSIERILKEVE